MDNVLTSSSEGYWSSSLSSPVRLQNPRRTDTGQKVRQDRDRRDSRRMSFQRPRGTIEYSVESHDTLNSIALRYDTTPNELVTLNKLFSRAVVPGKILYVPDPDYVSSVDSSPSLSPISPLSPTSSDPDLGKDSGLAHVHHRQSRLVSSTSEEEEALTEKFLKINCKYITDGKGIVSGVLLVTPNNIMFDPHKADVLVQQSGCEEYGIMCPLEDLLSAAMCADITDPRIRDTVPLNLELPPAGPEPGPMRRVPRSNLEDSAQRANDSASTAPRSTEASLSEDVFTESELSPVRDDQAEPRQRKSSGASSESVQTVNQAAEIDREIPKQGGDPGRAPSVDEPTERMTADASIQEDAAYRMKEQEEVGSGDEATPLTTTQQNAGKIPVSEGEAKSRTTSDSQGSETVAADDPVKKDAPQPQEHQSEMEELRKLWKSHAMSSTTDQDDSDQLTVDETTTANQEQCEKKQGSAEALRPPPERRRWEGVRFLCVRVGRPMRKTFVSQASASMQQYAQKDRKKHEYWFAVPPGRSEVLFSFFIQWCPEAFGEGGGRHPAFVVVKRSREGELGSDQPPVPDITSKDWEITTKEEANQKHSPAVRADPESEVFRPTLSDPSDLLTSDQIEKLAKHLPPRTIGYPWTLAFSTAKHGMSIKTLYRTMTGLDTPTLMVIRDSDRQVFGALASEPPKISDGFYGTGETFLFRFCPEFEVFKWTGDNMFFLKGDMDSLAFGGGGGEFGLWLDGDLYHGRSNPCKTFGNPRLSKREDFVLQDIEIWAFE